MKKTALVMAITAALAVLGGCSSQGERGTQASASHMTPALKSGIEQSHFDTSVRPQDDFFQYVNGGWLAHTDIPADKASWGSFDRLRYESDEAVKTLIHEAQQQSGKVGSSEQKIGDLYASFMDEQALEQLGHKPLQPLLAEIAAIDSYDQLSTLMGKLQRHQVTTPLGVFVVPDGKDARFNALYTAQDGIGMPDKDYYSKDDEKSVQLRADYQNMVVTMLRLIGEPNPEAQAKAVLGVETKLADIMWSRTKSREISLIYNPHGAAEFDSKLGKLNWHNVSDGLGLPAQDKIIVMQPSYFEELGTLFDQISLEDWQTYLKFHTVNSFAEVLSAPFADARFAFYSEALRGVTEQQPRWQRGVVMTNEMLGEEVGKLYVARHFSPAAKARMETLVQNLIAAYRTSIDNLGWMTDATKAAAQEKLTKVSYKIGYPDHWRSYDFEVKADDLVGNVIRARQHEVDYHLGQVGQPVDQTKWEMTPQTVNAYYHPLKNEIVFPAAILQPPFFDMSVDDAVNYGAIGAVIGHELGHGFDDQGAQFDGDGNIRNWWQDADLSQFKQRTDALVAQYDSYKPFKDAAVNGRMTLGENIGDLGGLTVAYKAYLLSLSGKNKEIIDGYTPEQRFFIGFAQSWRTKKREAAARQRLITDVHAPAQYRANGPLSNFTPFYEAFAVKEGDKLFRAQSERVKIW
ncbi:M13 family metallopeptidase [Pseudoalteromonas rubra]|uniref:Peptidase M13 n=1 Tax=Pseudoalteromonas rubra TaxID=43658 RepID=A0A0U3H3M9_9GAMM|nr:M13 family metallopeptidase [Pseudoalteromonas rubra]ALU45907.1 peptidase M13 [Pseudoalteromonas rubra]